MVEDSPEVAVTIKKALEPEDRVTACATLAEARAKLRSARYQLVLLDVSLPDGSGFDFLSDLRAANDAELPPVFFITGKDGVSDQVLGYALGADDYIVKPIQPAVFQAKVRAKLRRLRYDACSAEAVAYGDLRADLARQRAYRGDAELGLTTTELRLLVHFLSHPERVHSRDALITAARGDGVHVLDRTIDTHVSHIRQKLGPSRCRIEAVHGVGYRLIAKD
jgi:DNA-binding response OmpR family regulator